MRVANKQRRNYRACGRRGRGGSRHDKSEPVVPQGKRHRRRRSLYKLAGIAQCITDAEGRASRR